MSEREAAAQAVIEAARKLGAAMEACEPADAEFSALWAALARYNAAPADGWQPIETAPRDGTTVWVYVAARQGLPAFQTWCAYHPEAGWCADELRPITHWVPLERIELSPPGEDEP